MGKGEKEKGRRGDWRFGTPFIKSRVFGGPAGNKNVASLVFVEGGADRRVRPTYERKVEDQAASARGLERTFSASSANGTWAFNQRGSRAISFIEALVLLQIR